MLLVIFGAGASFDSAPTYPPGANVLGGDRLNNFHRPPLANELFENRPVFAEAITRLPECQDGWPGRKPQEKFGCPVLVFRGRGFFFDFFHARCPILRAAWLMCPGRFCGTKGAKFLPSPLPFASPYTTFWTFGVYCVYGQDEHCN